MSVHTVMAKMTSALTTVFHSDCCFPVDFIAIVVFPLNLHGSQHTCWNSSETVSDVLNALVIIFTICIHFDCRINYLMCIPDLTKIICRTFNTLSLCYFSICNCNGVVFHNHITPLLGHSFFNVHYHISTSVKCQTSEFIAFFTRFLFTDILLPRLLIFHIGHH